jgi:hypothetical protein
MLDLIALLKINYLIRESGYHLFKFEIIEIYKPKSKWHPIDQRQKGGKSMALVLLYMKPFNYP